MGDVKRVAIYARVSTDRQTNENQMLDLRRYCAMRGWALVQEFVDDGISGAKKSRPQLDRLMEFVHKGRCDGVLVWRYDRFARSGAHLVNTLEDFRQCGVDFASFHEGIDTTTPQGKFFFMVIAGFAEFERSLIIDRIHAGLRRAREENKRLGRPPSVSEPQRAGILALRGQASVRSIAARMGVSKSLVQKLLSTNPLEKVAFPADEDRVANTAVH